MPSALSTQSLLIVRCPYPPPNLPPQRNNLRPGHELFPAYVKTQFSRVSPAGLCSMLSACSRPRALCK